MNATNATLDTPVVVTLAPVAVTLAPDTLTSENATTDVAPASPEVQANNAKRHAARVAANAKLATLALATKLDSRATSSERRTALYGLEGAARKEAGKAWNDARRNEIMAKLDGSNVEVSMARVGRRVLLTGLTGADGETVAIKGEAGIVDLGNGQDPRKLDVAGITVTVKLERRTGVTPAGHERTGFTVFTVGTSSAGYRITLRGVVQASRYVRVLAASL